MSGLALNQQIEYFDYTGTTLVHNAGIDLAKLFPDNLCSRKTSVSGRMRHRGKRRVLPSDGQSDGIAIVRRFGRYRSGLSIIAQQAKSDYQEGAHVYGTSATSSYQAE